MSIQDDKLAVPDVIDRIDLALSILEGDLERLRNDLKRTEVNVISLKGMISETERNEKDDVE
jgi:hypothetical protein